VKEKGRQRKNKEIEIRKCNIGQVTEKKGSRNVIEGVRFKKMQ
jgi:hypothetical protein